MSLIADYVTDVLRGVENHVVSGSKAAYEKAVAPTLSSTGPEQDLTREQVIERHQTRGIVTRYPHHQLQVYYVTDHL